MPELTMRMVEDRLRMIKADNPRITDAAALEQTMKELNVERMAQAKARARKAAKPSVRRVVVKHADGTLAKDVSGSYEAGRGVFKEGDTVYVMDTYEGQQPVVQILRVKPEEPAGKWRWPTRFELKAEDLPVTDIAMLAELSDDGRLMVRGTDQTVQRMVNDLFPAGRAVNVSLMQDRLSAPTAGGGDCRKVRDYTVRVCARKSRDGVLVSGAD